MTFRALAPAVRPAAVRRAAAVRAAGALAAAVLAAAAFASAAPPARLEIIHPGKGHEVHLSAAAVGVAADGVPIVAWAAQEGHDNTLYAARPGRAAPRPERRFVVVGPESQARGVGQAGDDDAPRGRHGPSQAGVKLNQTGRWSAT